MQTESDPHIIYGGDYSESNEPLDEGRGSLGAVILNDLALGGDQTLFVSKISPLSSAQSSTLYLTKD
jgi:hypothetical protein